MNQYRWTTTGTRQHWLYYGSRIQGLVYMVNPNSYSVFAEGKQNPFSARLFAGTVDSLDEAKGLLLTLTGSKQ